MHSKFLALFGAVTLASANLCAEKRATGKFAHVSTPGGTELGNIGLDNSQNFDYWDYEWTAEPPKDAERFPNGFRTAALAPENNPPFCLKVRNTANRVVRVMIEPVPSHNKICVQDANANSKDRADGAIAPTRCSEGTNLATCFDAGDKDLELLFECEGGSCSMATVNFYYKIMATEKTRQEFEGEDGATASLDMWCPMLAGTDDIKFPSQLSDDEPELPAAVYNRMKADEEGDNTNTAALSHPYMTVITAIAAIGVAV